VRPGGGSRLAGLCFLLAMVSLLAPRAVRGEVVDRVVYVFHAPETGGPLSPRAIFERELAFEARVEALAAAEPLIDETGHYAARHLRAALDRHVATELLAHLPVERSKTLAQHDCDGPARPNDEDDIARRVLLARAVLTARVRGAESLRAAAEAEGLSEAEVARLLRREALAARYLDVMVTPMLAPNDAELRELHRATANPFRARPFEAARCDMRRWVIGQRLSAALLSFLQSSRVRVHLRRVRP
jgi:hypothetical protein